LDKGNTVFTTPERHSDSRPEGRFCLDMLVFVSDEAWAEFPGDDQVGERMEVQHRLTAEAWGQIEIDNMCPYMELCPRFARSAHKYDPDKRRYRQLPLL
jgi:hypothetical protein